VKPAVLPVRLLKVVLVPTPILGERVVVGEQVRRAQKRRGSSGDELIEVGHLAHALVSSWLPRDIPVRCLSRDHVWCDPLAPTKGCPTDRPVA
jgi:hypothetical protein